MSKRNHSSASRSKDNKKAEDTISKRVRFNQSVLVAETGSNNEADRDEFNFEDSLEHAKPRRGAVKLEGYGSDETDTSEDDGVDARFERRKALAKGKAKKDDDDMFASDDEAFGVDAEKGSKKKRKSKIKYLEMEQIQGQDFGSFDIDSDSEEIRIEAFNMNAELEEGKFDDAGNYIPNKKDPNEFHDNWLQGFSRDDIKKARIAHEKQQRVIKLKEAEEDSKGEMDRISIWKELLTILKRGENLLDALQRLGGGGSNNSKRSSKNKQKVYKKRRGKPSDTATEIEIVPMEEKVVETEESIKENKRKKDIERLTDLSDKMMALGHFNVYEDTWEEILRNLKTANYPQNSSTTQQLASGVDFSTQWEYKWTDSEEPANIYGPFSSLDMKAWHEQGYFSQGILVRRAGSTDEFISDTNVDFSS
ncbi:4931_t:CDS:2 [Ambispora gerdemannii]|uniref:4931_t:CDS:1 n=1 Tax=Ambispora gerdemannii TaxID=144530 RepID=A0A9N9FI50_9GLOM|nr:4931_t:CDS:2 [Ambispora gerdemannii]